MAQRGSLGNGRLGQRRNDKQHHRLSCSSTNAFFCLSTVSSSDSTLWMIAVLCLAFLQIFTICFYVYQFGRITIDAERTATLTTTATTMIENSRKLSFHTVPKTETTNSTITTDAEVIKGIQSKLDSLNHRLEYLEHHVVMKLPEPSNNNNNNHLLPRLMNDIIHANNNKKDIATFNRTLAFLHIGKTGGSSFDLAAKKFCPVAKYKYKGGVHFDWSYIERHINGVVGKDLQVVTLLREPVSRAISHFYFTQRQKWVKNTYFVHFSLQEFLHNRHALLEFRDIWQDGQAGVSWLSGTHIASWASVPKEEIPQRELRASNSTAMMSLAADRLESTLWFGILEDMDRSMELLQFELGLPTRIVLPHANKAKVSPLHMGHYPSETVTEEQKKELASLMPQDLWLYEYAKRLFQARWIKHKTGVYTAPERPPFPKLDCTSTRFELNCTSGPLADFFNKDKPQRELGW